MKPSMRTKLEQLAKRLIEFVGASSYQMVEGLATAVGRIVVQEFGAPWVKVSVAKPGAIPAALLALLALSAPAAAARKASLRG